MVIIALALAGGGCEDHGSLGAPPVADALDDVADAAGPDAPDAGGGDASDAATAPDAAGDSAEPVDTAVPVDGADARDGESPDTGEPHAPLEPLDPTQASPIIDRAAWLFTGPNAPQRGVPAGTIDPERVAIVLGEVLDPEGAPLVGVSVRVHRHLELGETTTDGTGRWALAVNGGGPLVVRFELAGRPPADRVVDVAWGAWEHLDPVVLTPRAAAATAVALGGAAASAPVVARGDPVDDGDGVRRATLLVAPATKASARDEGGLARPLERLDVRLTELSVGARGPLALPALLPPATAYAWAAEITADEALAAGVAGVGLDRDAVLYVEDFTGLPVGGAVPAARYDRARAAWVPVDDGAIVAIASADDEEVALDLDGDGIADPDAAAAIGVGDGERRRLGELYAAGARLWRLPLRELGAYAIGWPYALDATSTAPAGVPVADPARPATCRDPGRRVVCDDQVLGAELPIAGSGFSLVYRSDRTPGGSARGVTVPLVGEPVPADLARVRLDVQVAGERQDVAVAPSSNAEARVLWSGRDGFGRLVVGGATAQVRVRYDYRARYLTVPRARSGVLRAFGLVPPGSAPTTRRVRGDGVTLARRTRLAVARLDARELGVGGWDLAPHHLYDVVARQALLGSGERVGRAPGLLAVASAGDVGAGAVLARLAFHRDGAVWSLGDAPGAALERAGVGELPAPYFGGAAGCEAPSPDGTPVAEACVPLVDAFAFGPEGELVFAEPGRVRRVAEDGTLATVAGGGAATGDGGPATAAIVGRVGGLAVADDGTVYLSEAAQVRRVGPDGVVERVAGTGVPGFSGDGGPARDAQLDGPSSVALAPDGALLVLDAGNRRVRRVAPDGAITTLAGAGRGGVAGEPPGDGGPAVEALLDGVVGLAVDRAGAAYVTARDGGSGRAYTAQIAPGGRFHVVAGLGEAPLADGALAVGFAQPGRGDVAISQLGEPWLARAPGGIRLHEPFPRGFHGDVLVPAPGGRERWRFSERGRHLDTRDAVTDAVVRAFVYDELGRLGAIAEADGRRTRVERDAAGRPTAVVAANGERTTLETGSLGWLTAVIGPDGARTELEHDADGRLVAVHRPGGADATYAFGPGVGETRAVSATDPRGATDTLARAALPDGFAVTATTRGGRPWEVAVAIDVGRDEVAVADDAGGSWVLARGGDGAEAVTHRDGAVVSALTGPSARDRMRAPELRGATLATPGGAAITLSLARSVTPATGDGGGLWSANDTATLAGESWVVSTSAGAGTRVVTSPEGRVTALSFDASGRLATASGAGGAPVAWTRSGAGAIGAVTVGAGSATASVALAWEATGELASATLPGGERVAVLARDGAKRPTRALLPGGRELGVAWDERGNPTALTAPGGPVHAFAWDADDRLVGYEPPDAATIGGALTFERDPDGLLTRFAYEDGPGVDLVWDLAGRLTTVSTPLGAVHATYDAERGAVSRVTAFGGVVLDTSFDGPLLVSTRWSGALTGEIARSYDAASRLAALDIAGLAVPYERDRDGLVTAAGAAVVGRDAATGEVTSVTVGVVTTTLERDARGRVTRTAATAGGGPIFEATYAYDAAGAVARVTEVVDGVATERVFGHDAAGRITALTVDGVSAGSWAWDARGNRTTASSASVTTHASYDAQDRLVSAGAATWEHGPSGARERRTDGDGVTLYAIDAFGDLRAATLPGGVGLAYLVDGRGRRVAKRRDGALEQAWLWLDGARPAAEIGADGVVARRFVWASGGRSPDYQVTAEGAVQALVRDRDGSVRVVVDAATGAVLARRGFGPFGETTEDTDPLATPFGWRGGLPDADTGFVLLEGRDYDPATARFIAKAPDGLGAGDPNLYALGGDDAGLALAPVVAQGGRVCAALAAACAPTAPVAPDRRLEAVRAWLDPAWGGARWRGVDRPAFGPSDLRAPAPLGGARSASPRAGGPLVPLLAAPIARALGLGDGSPVSRAGAWLADPGRVLWTGDALEAVAPAVPGLCAELAPAFCR